VQKDRYLYVTPPEPIADYMAKEGIDPALMKRGREGAIMRPLTAGPRETWPSEIAKANRRELREQEHGKSKEQSHNQDGGYSV